MQLPPSAPVENDAIVEYVQHMSNDRVLVEFDIKRLRDRVWSMTFKRQHEMCMTFLRYQEYYESPKFEGKSFTLAEYMSWYAQEQSKDGTFSYEDDWGGFNIPINIIHKVHCQGIKDPNHYDELMMNVARLIDSRDKDAYLIGTPIESGIDDHELTHAMYYIDRDYRDKCDEVLYNHRNIARRMGKILTDNGYHYNTVYDEIQAYITTGDYVGYFNDMVNDPEYQLIAKKLSEFHDKRYAEFKKDMTSSSSAESEQLPPKE